MPQPWPVNPATFDGTKFATRYKLKPGQFWIDGEPGAQLLHTSAPLLPPDDPPIFELPDTPAVARRAQARTRRATPLPETVLTTATALALLDLINQLRSRVTPPLPPIQDTPFRLSIDTVIDAGRAD